MNDDTMIPPVTPTEGEEMTPEMPAEGEAMPAEATPAEGEAAA